MSWRVKAAIVLAVLLAHGAIFLLIGQMRALPNARHVPPRPTPNFFTREEVIVDPATGGRAIYREIQVSTKLADPKTLPPPPAAPQP